jgi:hypothetical protein
VAVSVLAEAGIEHVSASSLNRFIRCPESYRQRYVCGIKDPAGGKALVGSAVDKAIGDYYTARIGGGPGLDQASVEDSLRDHLLREADSFVLEDESTGDMIDKAIPLVRAYLPVMQAKPDPIAVQRRIEIKRDSLPVPVIGFIDTEFENVVTDTKVAANKSIHPDWIIQNRIYSAATSKPASWDVVTKTKVPAVYTADDGPQYQESWSQAKADRTIRLVGQIVGSIEAMVVMFGVDTPWPTTGISHPWGCLVCSYRKNCAAWS